MSLTKLEMAAAAITAGDNPVPPIPLTLDQIERMIAARAAVGRYQITVPVLPDETAAALTDAGFTITGTRISWAELTLPQIQQMIVDRTAAGQHELALPVLPDEIAGALIADGFTVNGTLISWT